jgi:hypothetical protein
VDGSVEITGRATENEGIDSVYSLEPGSNEIVDEQVLGKLLRRKADDIEGIDGIGLIEAEEGNRSIIEESKDALE